MTKQVTGRRAQKVYINPFLAGILCTVFAEIAALLVFAVVMAKRK